jgi:hypothetical protein
LSLIQVMPAQAAAEPDIVLYAADAVNLKGNWTRVADASAAGGQMMSSANIGWSAATAPLAAPFHSFDFTFNAAANTPYHIWLRSARSTTRNTTIRVRAASDTSDVNDAARARIGTADALLVNLATGQCVTSSAGDGRMACWFGQATTVKFASTGTHAAHPDAEDGFSSSVVSLTWLLNSPGSVTSDNKIIPDHCLRHVFRCSRHRPPRHRRSRIFYNGRPGIATRRQRRQ